MLYNLYKQITKLNENTMQSQVKFSTINFKDLKKTISRYLAKAKGIFVRIQRCLGNVNILHAQILLKLMKLLASKKFLVATKLSISLDN